MIEKIKDSEKSGKPQDTVILHGFPSRNGTSSASPFVGKIELYLRMNSIPYEIKMTNTQMKAPKKKVTTTSTNKNTYSHKLLIN